MRVQARCGISLWVAPAGDRQILFRRRRLYLYPFIVRRYRSQSQSMAGYPAYFSLCPRINRRNRSYNCKRLLILSQSAYSTAVCCPNAICQRPSLFTKYPRHLQHFSVQRSVFLAHHRRVSERPHLPRFTCKRVVVSRACSHTSSQY